MEIDAAEARLRSERRLGELMADMPKATNQNKKAAGVQHTPAETLADCGIDKNGDALLRLSKDLGASIEEVRAIQKGRLLLIGKIGELLPAKSRKETGRGKKKLRTQGKEFSEKSLAAYRKVSKWRDRIDDYCLTADDPSMADFIRHNTDASRAKKDQQRAAKRAKAAQSIASLRQRDWSGRSGKKSRQPVSKSDRLGVTRRYNPTECL